MRIHYNCLVCVDYKTLTHSLFQRSFKWCLFQWFWCFEGKVLLVLIFWFFETVLVTVSGKYPNQTTLLVHLASLCVRMNSFKEIMIANYGQSNTKSYSKPSWNTYHWCMTMSEIMIINVWQWVKFELWSMAFSNHPELNHILTFLLRGKQISAQWRRHSKVIGLEISIIKPENYFKSKLPHFSYCPDKALHLPEFQAEFIFQAKLSGWFLVTRGCLPFTKKNSGNFGWEFSVGKNGTCRLPWLFTIYKKNSGNFGWGFSVGKNGTCRLPFA